MRLLLRRQAQKTTPAPHMLKAVQGAALCLFLAAERTVCELAFYQATPEQMRTPLTANS